MMPKITKYGLVFFSFLFLSCENWYCESEGIEDKTDTNSTIRFNTLDEPINGTLYFFAGPTITEIDTFYLQKYPLYYWKLEGIQFSQLNQNPIPDEILFSHPNDRAISPNGNYFPYYYVDTTNYTYGELGIYDLDEFREIPLTEEVGSTNPGYYHRHEWATNEEYIYFSAFDYGMTNDDNNGNVDIYRIKPDGNNLQKLTDLPYQELAGTPSPDGMKIAFIVDKNEDTPSLAQGYYILDINTAISKQVKNVPYKLYTQGSAIVWHPSSDFCLVKSSRLASEGLTYIDARSESSRQISIFSDDIYYIESIQFIANTNQILIIGRNDYQNEWNNFIGIYDLDTDEYIDLSDKFGAILLMNSETPTLSPDGKYIAYIGSNELAPGVYSDMNYFYLNPDQKVTSEIFTLNLSDYSIRQLTKGLYGYEHYLRWTK